MALRKSSSKMYTTAQLTTAKLPNIHDLSLQVNPETGEWEIACNLLEETPQAFSTVQPSVDVVDDDVILLNAFGRRWISWKDACKMHNTGRQFLNYRILNHCPHLDILRLQPHDARVLSQLTGGGWMPANRDSKLIFFDHIEMAKLHLQPFKKRTKSGRSGSVSGDERPEKNRERRHGKRKHSVTSIDFESEDEDFHSSSLGSPMEMEDDEGLSAPTSEFGHEYRTSFHRVPDLSSSPDNDEPMQLRKRLRLRHSQASLFDDDVVPSDHEAEHAPLDFVSRVRDNQRRQDEYQHWLHTILAQSRRGSRNPSRESSPLTFGVVKELFPTVPESEAPAAAPPLAG